MQGLLVEKYRPSTIDDCILPIALKSTFKDIVKSGECQNLLLTGGAGCGKTMGISIPSEQRFEHLPAQFLLVVVRRL